jgi:hypothetical protein
MRGASGLQVGRAGSPSARLSGTGVEACSACAGDYEDPERTAGAGPDDYADSEFAGDDAVDGDDSVLTRRIESGGEES